MGCQNPAKAVYSCVWHVVVQGCGLVLCPVQNHPHTKRVVTNCLETSLALSQEEFFTSPDQKILKKGLVGSVFPIKAGIY